MAEEINLYRFATPLELRHLVEEALGPEEAGRFLAAEPRRMARAWIGGAATAEDLEADARESRVMARVLPPLTSGALVILGWPEEDPGRREPEAIAPPFLRQAGIEWAEGRVAITQGGRSRVYIGCVVTLPPSLEREDVPQVPLVPRRELLSAVPALPSPSLREPDKVDAWAEAILAAEEDHRREHGAPPRQRQLWHRLRTNPPPGYGITWDAAAEALRMAGEGWLKWEGFDKRYKRMAR
jgi:hypothetical protein